MNEYALIGKPLGHSFSKKYFDEKFAAESIDSSFTNYELDDISAFPGLIAAHPRLRGLSVTIPYKRSIIPLLNEVDAAAAEIGAVNCVKVRNGRTVGYNTDVTGFTLSVQKFLPAERNGEALVLGTGGAAAAVLFALRQHFTFSRVCTVSRRPGEGDFTYEELKGRSLEQWQLIVNTTPLGTWPRMQECPDLNYPSLVPGQHLMDLIYNPAETQFMKEGQARGCTAQNGLEMLHLQAQAAWEIWNRPD